jgi:hypothetical protein
MPLCQRQNVAVCKIIVNDEALDWKCELRYLGVHVVSANVLRYNLQVMRQK